MKGPSSSASGSRSDRATRPSPGAMLQHLAALFVRHDDSNRLVWIGPEYRLHVVAALDAANDAVRLISRRAWLAKAQP